LISAGPCTNPNRGTWWGEKKKKKRTDLEKKGELLDSESKRCRDGGRHAGEETARSENNFGLLLKVAAIKT